MILFLQIWFMSSFTFLCITTNELNILYKYYHSHDKTSSWKALNFKFAFVKMEKQCVTGIFLICICHIYCLYSKHYIIFFILKNINIDVSIFKVSNMLIECESPPEGKPQKGRAQHCNRWLTSTVGEICPQWKLLGRWS